MKQFVFNGRSSRDWHIGLSGTSVFNAPARDVESIAIPGRNGTLTIDNGRFENIDVTYPCWIAHELVDHIDGFRAFMASQPGYHRLEDDYHPGEYRLAQFVSPLDVTPGTAVKSGRFDVTFDCKPQRFLNEGEHPRHIDADGELMNPTLFSAKPLIRVYGVGSFSVNGVTMEISDADGWTDIDCDTENAYKIDGGAVINKNPYVTEDFPELVPGVNEITLAGVTLDITPRWWTI